MALQHVRPTITASDVFWREIHIFIALKVQQNCQWRSWTTLLNKYKVQAKEKTCRVRTKWPFTTNICMWWQNCSSLTLNIIKVRVKLSMCLRNMPQRCIGGAEVKLNALHSSYSTWMENSCQWTKACVGTKPSRDVVPPPIRWALSNKSIMHGITFYWYTSGGRIQKSLITDNYVSNSKCFILTVSIRKE
jgi:hypothetical protein